MLRRGRCLRQPLPPPEVSRPVSRGWVHVWQVVPHRILIHLPSQLLHRVGLNSGEVVVRAIGSDLHIDYSAISQTTHLAARMEQLAPPGSIRLTAATWRLAEGFIQVTTLGSVPVKGLMEPVEEYELVGVTTVRRRLRAWEACPHAGVGAGSPMDVRGRRRGWRPPALDH
jgi:class 3 adenylate cyclase